jgi:predicted RNase H-like nuclease (RuvC/YqgF family)
MSITNLTDTERRLQEENEELRAEIERYKNVIEVTEREIQRMAVRIRDLETHVNQLRNIGALLDRKVLTR